MRPLRSVAICLHVLLPLLAASPGRVHAQGNDLAAPSGGRSTLMGNTGVALGRDGSAPFYNPATIVRIRDQRLAFSVNFYSLGVTHFDDWHQPGAVDQEQFGDRNLGGTGLLETGFRSLPSTLCLFFTIEQLASVAFGKSGDDPGDDGSGSSRDQRDRNDKAPTGKKLAICFATLESDDVDMQALHFRGETSAGPTAQVQSLQRRWQRTYVGPTYSISITRRFAIGGSAQVAYSYDSFGVNSDSLSSRAAGGGIASALGTSGSGKSFELTGVIGATYRIDRLTLGASVRLPSLHILGDYSGTFSQSYTGDQDVSLIADASGSLKSAPPTRFAIGAGFALDRWTLELDAALNVPLQNTLTAELDVTTTRLEGENLSRDVTREKYVIPSHFTFNPSFGFEYFATQALSLLGGVSTNFTSLAPLTPVRSVGNLVQARMNHISASAGIGSYWSKGELLFGLQFDYGWGQAIAVNPYVVPNDWSVVDTQSYALLFVIAGSTNLSSIVRVVNTIVNGGEAKPEKSDEPKQRD
ncbi:MAG: hypothetical protein ABW321_16215 [Polyangiales bacterium]